MAVAPVDDVPVLETARLRLRGHRLEDHADCAAVWGDAEITRFLGGRAFSSEEVWRRMLSWRGLWSMLGYGYWAVEEKDGGRYVGDIGFADFRRELDPSLKGMLEFGWILAPAAHGKGYASEAVAAATAWAERELPHMRSVCIIAPGNLASIRVAERAGFREWRRSVYHGEPTIVFCR